MALRPTPRALALAGAAVFALAGCTETNVVAVSFTDAHGRACVTVHTEVDGIFVRESDDATVDCDYPPDGETPASDIESTPLTE